MIGLVDGNNFYVSCERVFNPGLIGKPVIVLSNNDGCVISRSNEAKALGIKMGIPTYQIREEINKNNIEVFSSNYALYGDMSSRMTSIIASMVPKIEVYSIDESFIDLSGISDIHALGEEIVQKTTKFTGIPVSLGIGQTKTLAKVANKFAKKYKGYNRVCIIDTEEKRIKALQQLDIADVWGIGRRLARKLNIEGVSTAYDFIQKPRSWVRKYMTVTGERTWKELNGEPCINMGQVEPPKKQICTSRMFGKKTGKYSDLYEAIASYASICAQQLRRQKSFAVSLMVFVYTGKSDNQGNQYYRNCIIQLPVPTNSTIEIVKHAHHALNQIYKEGILYSKSGVIITELTPEVQLNLFESLDHEKHSRIMKVIDQLNSGYHEKIFLASQGTQRDWKIKRDCLSQCYTTKLSDVIKVKCKEEHATNVSTPPVD